MSDKFYAIAEADLVAIADRTRAMAGTNEPLSIQEIIYWLGRVAYIPQARGTAEFILCCDTPAYGSIPNVAKTSGVSQMILDMRFSIAGEIVTDI